EGATGEREPESDCANGAPPAASVFRRETHSTNHNDLAGPRKTRESSLAKPAGRRRQHGRPTAMRGRAFTPPLHLGSYTLVAATRLTRASAIRVSFRSAVFTSASVGSS